MDLTETDDAIRDSLEVYLTAEVPDGSTLKVIGMIVDKNDFEDIDDANAEDFCLAKLEEEVCFSEDNSMLGCLGDDDDDDSSSGSSSNDDMSSVYATAMTEGVAIGLVGAGVIFLGLWYGGKLKPVTDRSSSASSASPNQIGKGWEVAKKKDKQMI
mmetsp:Transcript_107366/g.311989  ORF Transcript_107366/g.311989 Transcript_107366/m.311989 type:complete len:156 (-) Transcript_107366:1893-2360(-)